jgi:DNA-directed RNA polymerase beta subunit
MVQKVVVSQLHRSPGCFFETVHPKPILCKNNSSARFMGEFATDINYRLNIYSREKKKFQQQLFRALGYTSKRCIFNLLILLK